MGHRNGGPANKGKGAGIAWVRAHVDYAGNDCLIWPMARLHNGYGHMGWNGTNYYPHRLICEFAHGPQPSPEYEAAHSCGRGHDGCCNPRHLSWKTKSGNLRDCRGHGTHVRSVHGISGRLTKEQVEKIRGLRGQATQAVIAAEFGVSEPTVRDIFLGRSHKGGPPKVNLYSKDEEARLVAAVNRKVPVKEIAALLNRPENGIYSKLKRLGLPCP